jgi:uncharacterized membrane protein YadS
MIDATDLLSAVLLLYNLFERMDTKTGPVFIFIFIILMAIKGFCEIREEMVQR